MSASIATTAAATAAAEVLILIFFFFPPEKGCLVGVGVGGDSTGTQAPAERSGWLFWARQAGRPVGGKKGLARAPGS